MGKQHSNKITSRGSGHQKRVPVMASTLDLIRIMTQAFRNMPSDIKHMYGVTMTHTLVMMMTSLHRANRMRGADRRAQLMEFSSWFDQFEAMIDILDVNRLLGDRLMAAIIEASGSIRRQVNGWYNSASESSAATRDDSASEEINKDTTGYA